MTGDSPWSRRSKLSELVGNLVAGGQNFKVVKASPYIITLNLTNAGKYTYSMEETTIELSSSAMTLPEVAIRVVMVGSRKLMIAIR